MDEIDLTLHSRPIRSIFELLGTKENDITYSLGWALARSPALRRGVLSAVIPGQPTPVVDRIELQRHGEDSGFTDVEMFGPTAHVIIEAKRGWCVPGEDQLRRYLPRMNRTGVAHALVAMSECSAEYARPRLPKSIDGVAIKHMSWSEVQRLTVAKGGSHAEKRLLRQLSEYLERIVKVQRQDSNMVYVAALSMETPTGSTISWTNIVERGRYFHPVGGPGGWPKEPPNYFGFRYGGRLQSIHHVESWKVVDDLRADLPEVSLKLDGQHFLYTLGPAVPVPPNVRTGELYRSGRVWAMLDLLLTCKTIKEASERTKERLKER